MSAVIFALASLLPPAFAQTVSIPDAGLNAAIRAALHIPAAPLTAQDLLTLTNLDASRRNVTSTVGLEAARNLVSLNLQLNQLTNFFIPTTLTKLSVLDLSGNPLTSFSPPSSLTNLTSLTLEACGLTNLAIPPTLTALTNLGVQGNALSAFNLSSNLAGLVSLDLGVNQFTSFSLPPGLTNLSTFYFAINPLTNVTFPPDLSGLTELNLSQNLLTNFTLPTGMTHLEELDLSFNQLTNVNLPSDLRNLSDLELSHNRLTSVQLPPNLTNLHFLRLRDNLFTSYSVPPGLTALIYLDVSRGPLTNITFNGDLGNLHTLLLTQDRLRTFTLPLGLTNLVSLVLSGNLLTNLVLPSDLNRLDSIDLGGNALTSLTLPSGLTHLTGLFLQVNQLTHLTLPPDMTNLTSLSFFQNPFTTLVISETLAASTNLRVNLTTLSGLPNEGVAVFTYPPALRLSSPQRTESGAFKFTLTGPPGVYAMLGSTDLATWSEVGIASNTLGSINFTDVTAHLSARKFYRAWLQSPPANMVFIPAGTFTMGTPANEVNRQPDEGPQTTVTVTRGFWMGKYEVTQAEYLAVLDSNPSGFPGDLNRPVESVSWLDATNYCARLTQQELAAGHISPGSHYRLPTEAEWEYAARAGTTTRFSYGDDPNYTNLPDHAWYSANAGFGTHPVGQKLPNPWGLYDIEGNVLEWTLDWYGPFPGGSTTDPQGPASNPIGFKVIRGGAWDSFEADCRSGRRQVKAVSPFITDFILGFRVVLVMEPQ